MNGADAAAASTLGTLERFVYSALSNAKKWSKGKYTWVYHFDSKAAVVEYVKEKYPQLDAKMSTLQVGEYATNWKKMPILGPQKVSPHFRCLKRRWQALGLRCRR